MSTDIPVTIGVSLMTKLDVYIEGEKAGAEGRAEAEADAKYAAITPQTGPGSRQKPFEPWPNPESSLAPIKPGPVPESARGALADQDT